MLNENNPSINPRRAETLSDPDRYRLSCSFSEHSISFSIRDMLQHFCSNRLVERVKERIQDVKYELGIGPPRWHRFPHVARVQLDSPVFADLYQLSRQACGHHEYVIELWDGDDFIIMLYSSELDMIGRILQECDREILQCEGVLEES